MFLGPGLNFKVLDVFSDLISGDSCIRRKKMFLNYKYLSKYILKTKFREQHFFLQKQVFKGHSHLRPRFTDKCDPQSRDLKKTL